MPVVNVRSASCAIPSEGMFQDFYTPAIQLSVPLPCQENVTALFSGM